MKRFFELTLFAVVLWGLYVFFTLSNQGDSIPARDMGRDSPNWPRNSIEVGGEWRNPGGILTIDLVFSNVGEKPVKNITVNAHVRGESGAPLKSLPYLATIILQPGENRTLKGINFGFMPQQGHSVNLTVVSAQWAEN